MPRKPHSLSTGSITKCRREFLRHGLAGMGVLVTGALVSSCRESTPPATGGMISGLKRKLGSRLCSLGPLHEPDENGVALPNGFTSRIVARSGQEPVTGCGYRWHAAPDGAAVFPAEDGGNNQLMALAPDGNPAPILQVIGHDGSEIAGPAFDPSGTRLYFSSQRGSSGESEDGVTFEIAGPFAG